MYIPSHVQRDKPLLALSIVILARQRERVKEGISGLLEGNTHQFIAQCVGAGAAMVYAFVVTYILAVIIDKTIGLRVTEEEEYVGLDISQHGERC